MKRTVLITRPEEDALPLAETLRARELRVLIEPMLRIKPTREVKIDLEGVQALLFSSSNGVRAFAAMVRNRDLPVYTTGEASARVARNLGFKSVEGADGDVSGLVRLVRQRLKPEDGALFHGAGSVVAGDLATQLSNLGYNLRREVVYEAVQADALSPQLLQRFEAGEIDMVLLFSPRTAETFLSLMGAAGEKQPALRDALRNVTALCMSRAVADTALRATWRSVEVAERPELNAMLGLIERTVTALDSDAEEIAVPPEAPGPSTAAAPGPRPRPSVDVEPTGAPRRRGRWVWISAAAVTLFVVLAGLATMPAWRSLLRDFAGPDEVVSTPAPAPTAEPASETATPPEPAAEAMAPEEAVAIAEPDDTGEAAATTEAAGEETAPAEAPADEAPADEALADTDSSQATTDAGSGEATADGGEAAVASTATDTTENAEPGTEPAANLSGQETGSTDAAMAGAGAGAGVADPRIDELMVRLAAIEQAVASGADGGDSTSADALAEIEDRLATLEESEGSQAAASDELATLSERVAAIEQLLIDFMTEVPAESLADVKTEVQRLIDENEGLRGQLATLTERFEQADSTAFMLAVGRLGAALNEGRPFEAELETLRKLAAADPALGRAQPALEILSPFAAGGAPSVIALTARFPETARAIVQAAQQEGVGADTESSGWFDRLLGRISELVTVRPVGEDVEGDGPAARVARAEARLSVGDLAGAVAELDGLTGAPAEAAAAWLATARARLAVVPAFDTLDALALERLGTGAGGGAATGG